MCYMNVSTIQVLIDKYTEFNYIFERTYFKKVIQYGIINGSNTIVFIKPGQDGTLVGYKDKYYNLAKYINKKYGYTVICSNNPYDKIHDPLIDAMEVIESFVQHMNYSDYVIYYYGNSNGSVIGASYAHNYPSIKRMLLINSPLFINFHRLKDGVENFNGEKIVFVYGELDPSYKFVGLLDLLNQHKLSYYIINGEDHNLSNGSVRLEDLVDNYLVD